MGDLIVGIDVGGTFTDVVAVSPSQQVLFTAKVPSQPNNPASAFMDGLARVCAQAACRPSDVERLVHGTTIATNAVLEHKGASLGILTTLGFEDILIIGRLMRTEIYDLLMDPEEPLFLAPRRQITGIPERIDASGQVVRPLDEAAVVREVQRLQQEYGIEAVAVCYLFSFLNSEHEQRTAAIIHEHFPELSVSLSSTVNPKFREYERLVVTAFDGYLRPVITTYVTDLERELETHQYKCSLQIMQSNGGITSATLAAERPVSTILSGPAAGVVAGSTEGLAAGFEHVVTVDIGGTSCDVALVRGGAISSSWDGRIERYPVRVPMVDVHTIGSGGGSIAWLDPAGGLKVGPQSAGAMPGPACYGRGGIEPTVTDASIILNYLNPATYAGGGFALDPELAREAIDRRIAGPLGLSITDAASGIHEIVNTQMAEAVRLVSVNRGHDLRGIALVAQGGAGPIHAGRLLSLLDAQAVVVPTRPGVSSAYGLLLADIRHEATRPYPRHVADALTGDLVQLFAELDEQCGEQMRRDGVPAAQVIVERYAEMRYVGQSFELDVPLPTTTIGEDILPTLLARFHQTHETVYGHSSPESPAEFLGVRAVHRYPLSAPPAELPTGADRVEAARTDRRRAFFAESGWVDTPIYDRFALPVGATLDGPAILEQTDSTTVVYPGQVAHVHPTGSVIITSIDTSRELGA